MTGKEIWHSCLYTAVAACTGIFLWSVATSLKNIANTFNKWSPENICNDVSQAMKQKDGLSDAVADFVTKVCAAINRAIKDDGGLSDTARELIREVIVESCDAFNDECTKKGGLSDTAKELIRNVIDESCNALNKEFERNGLFDNVNAFLEGLLVRLADRGIVIAAETMNMMRDARVGIGVNIVGRKLSEEQINATRRNIVKPRSGWK